MDLLANIVERFVIHFFAATSLVLLVTMALASARRRWPVWYLPKSVRLRLIVAALLVFACSILREAYDVWNGQALIKAFTDDLSWALGSGAGAWGLYRFWRAA